MSQVNIEGSTGTGSGSYLINNTPTKVLSINNYRAILEVQNQDPANAVMFVAMPISMTTPPTSAPAAPVAGTPTTVAGKYIGPLADYAAQTEQIPENAFYAYTVATGKTAVISILEG